MKREALYYVKKENGSVKCSLCPHNCVIRDGKTGLCGVRKNVSGKLYTGNYGQITSLALDPMEKKPLKRFLPGTKILSVGTFGCNFKCDFCQNWRISQGKPPSTSMEPGELTEKALEMEKYGNVGVAFTYNEPIIWYEYVMDTAVLNRKKGLKNVLVTNGYGSKEPFDELLKYIDGINIDLKAFDDDFYRRFCGAGGALEDVKNSIIKASQRCHTEVSCLIIPDLNDSEEKMEEMARWLRGISKDLVLHISRYFPSYLMNRPPTPVSVIDRLYDVASKHLNYVFKGNI